MKKYQYILLIISLLLATPLYALTLKGVVQPIEVVEIDAPENVVIQEVYVTHGQVVSPETPLFKTGSDDLRFNFINNFFAYLSAKKRDKINATEAENFKQYAKLNISPAKQSVLRQWERQVSKINANHRRSVFDLFLMASKFNSDIYNINLDDAEAVRAIASDSSVGTITFKSPINGVVIQSQDLSVGQSYQRHQTILVIGHTDGIAVTIFAELDQLESIKLGQSVKITSSHNLLPPLRGEVARINYPRVGDINAIEKPKVPIKIVVRDITQYHIQQVPYGSVVEVEFDEL